MFDISVQQVAYILVLRYSYDGVFFVSFLHLAPIVLVGNKKDLRTDIATVHELANWKLKPVQAEAGLALSEKIDAYAYCECSVKLEEGIVEVIETAVRAALSTKKKGCCIMI